MASASLPKKVFPLRLPQNFHGPVPMRASLRDSIKSKYQERVQDEDLGVSRKVVNWQRKRLDADIVRQRRQMLVHPGKISEQNPEWLKTTFDYFRRGAILPKSRQTRAQWESYDIFGRARQLSFAQTPAARSRFSHADVTPKIGTQNRMRSTGYRQVSAKVGSLEVRDLRPPRQQLKIGKADCIDTYSPF